MEIIKANLSDILTERTFRYSTPQMSEFDYCKIASGAVGDSEGSLPVGPEGGDGEGTMD